MPISMTTVFPVTCHTDFVGPNSVFVAIEGYTENGVVYIKKAIENGARTIVVHHDTILDEQLITFIKKHNAIIHRVENTRKAVAVISADAAGHPAKQLKIIGITGTKDKTTTAFLLEHILAQSGHKTALISSAQNRICGASFPASLTTPQPDYLQQFLKLCVDNDVEYVVMEVAAQALTLHRINGISFCGIVFTNFSHEHLEFYGNLTEYFTAKSLIFDYAQENIPILINGDNKYTQTLLTNYQSAISYGFNPSHDYWSRLSDFTHAIALDSNHKNVRHQFFCPTLFGQYNAYNLLAATSMALALNIQPDAINNALSSFIGIPGRLQKHILPNGAQCFIDYAHNPESFHAILSTLRHLTPQLIVVFGAGGGKDKLKRPMMGSVAATIADKVIITSDNPRQEDPYVIAQDIIQDISTELESKFIQELDRKKAIEQAYQLSNSSSIIALLGKGPDEYQIIGTTKYPFSEQAIIEQL